MPTRLDLINKYFTLAEDYQKKVQKIQGRQPPIIPYHQLQVDDKYVRIQNTDMVIKLETKKKFSGIRMVAGGPCQVKRIKCNDLVLQTR